VSEGWTLISSVRNEIEAPNSGNQQTASAVFDVDGDGINDFVITERTAAPGVVWYQRLASGWKRHVLDPERTLIEAGATFFDVDGDGDLDFVAGGEGRSNQVWWYENPRPGGDVTKPWKRHTLKTSGANKHHDLIAADCDLNGRAALYFWNQGARTLFSAPLPANPRDLTEWPRTAIFEYTSDSEMEQRGLPASFRSVNEHEGLTVEDINLDGFPDLVGGGYWFQRVGKEKFLAHTIDASYHFSRSAAGQLIHGGRPEVLLAVGDGEGPLMMYEWVKGTWKGRSLGEVNNAHSLAVVDFNRDGFQDIFYAEMRLNSGNPSSKTVILLGDGKGGFRPLVVAEGLDNHESKIADLDGDGDLDILVKPYNHETPAIHVLLNGGTGPRKSR
jgi:hypothetical protein